MKLARSSFYYKPKGKDACGARCLPKAGLESLIIAQIKEKVLTQECLEQLVTLVNEELDSTHGVLKDKLDVIDAELNDVRARLSKLYDALETGKLSLDDLATRIRELKSRQDQLSSARVQVEAGLVLQGVQHVDGNLVKSYAQDLRGLLDEADFTQNKTFLRSFIRRIVIDGNEARIHYNLPMPPDGKRTHSIGVLPIDTSGGEGGTRTPMGYPT